MNQDVDRIIIRRLEGFDDPRVSAREWHRIAEQGDTYSVFQTFAFQKDWWTIFGRGRLVLLIAERDGRAIALAPLFVDGGMAFLVGSGGSDYLDFLGDLDDPAVLPAMIKALFDAHPGLLGFKCYLVPDASRTGSRLQAAARTLGLVCHDEGGLTAPVLALDPDPSVARRIAGKKSLMRHERYFQRTGALKIEHWKEGACILPRLDDFFAQHVARWQDTSFPSLFTDPVQCSFYRQLARDATAGGSVRFTCVMWNDRMIAAHFGFCHRGTYLWYKPSFDRELARHSPGEVLLRHLLLAAIDERAHTFDFGIGDEAFKRRFASRAPVIRNWGLYPLTKGDPS